MVGIKEYIANKSNYGGKRSTSDIKYIVIHYTGNDGDSGLLVKQDCPTVPLPSGRSHSQFSKPELCSYNGLQPGKTREGQEKEKSLYL